MCSPQRTVRITQKVFYHNRAELARVFFVYPHLSSGLVPDFVGVAATFFPSVLATIVTAALSPAAFASVAFAAAASALTSANSVASALASGPNNSGRYSQVAFNASLRRQRLIRAWLPFRSTSGTSRPSKTSGR